MRFIASLLVCIAFSQLARAQTTWYVDLNGAPPGTGTQLDPYSSIQYAISQATTANGDTVLVLPGAYVEQVDSMGKQITIASAAGPLETTIASAAPGVVVRLGNVVSVVPVLEGFTVTSATTNSTGVIANSGTIRRCLIHGVGTGVLVEFDGWIDECTITGNDIGLHAIYIAGCGYSSNSILWGNVLDFQDDTRCSSFDHCIADTKLTEDGLTHLGGPDPLFWDAPSLDLHLRPGSPAIDAGNPADPLDPDGSVIDVGALTFDPTYAPTPTAYCTAKTNSLGCVPSIGASGTASATSASPFLVLATNELSSKPGLLFYGYAPNGNPYQGGWLCVQAPTKRTAVQDSGGNFPPTDCSGVYSFDFRARIQSGVDPALVPGEIVYCQYWSRDAGSPSTTNRSDALRFGIAP